MSCLVRTSFVGCKILFQWFGQFPGWSFWQWLQLFCRCCCRRNMQFTVHNHSTLLKYWRRSTFIYNATMVGFCSQNIYVFCTDLIFCADTTSAFVRCVYLHGKCARELFVDFRHKIKTFTTLEMNFLGLAACISRTKYMHMSSNLCECNFEVLFGFNPECRLGPSLMTSYHNWW